MTRKFTCAVITVLLIILALGIRTATGATAVECLKKGELAFHDHVLVSLVIINDGLEETIPFVVPSQLGFDQSNSCLLEIHTHDNSGILHIESTMAEKVFTVPDLLEYLGKQLSISTKNHDRFPPLLIINGYPSMSHWQRIQGMPLENGMEIVILLRVK